MHIFLFPSLTHYLLIKWTVQNDHQSLHLGPIFRTLVRFRTFLIKVVRKWSGFASKVRILGRIAYPWVKILYIIVNSSIYWSNVNKRIIKLVWQLLASFCNAFGGSNIVEADTPGCLRTLQDPPDPPLSLSLQLYRVSGAEILIWL